MATSSSDGVSTTGVTTFEMGPSRRYEALGGEGGAVCSLTSQKRQHRAFSALAECQTVRNFVLTLETDFV